MKIFPSLVSSDLLNLGKTVSDLDSLAAGFHIDVMDGDFVPNLTWGAMFVNALSKATKLPLHVHLMVRDPISWLEKLLLKENDYFIFHIESFDFPDSELAVDALIELVRKKNYKIGIALNPKTDVNVLDQFLSKIDLVLIMSVEPGFSGQKFIPEVKNKIANILELRRIGSLKFTIAIDGGVNASNCRDLVSMGVDELCMATAIFGEQDPVKSLRDLL